MVSKEVETARAIQSQYDKEHAAKARQNAERLKKQVWIDKMVERAIASQPELRNQVGTERLAQLAEEQYNRDVASAEEKLEQTLETLTPRNINDSPITPVYYLVNRDYYIAYDSAYGVLIVKKIAGAFRPFRLRNKKSTVFKEVTSKRWGTQWEKDEKANDLTKAEFDNIIRLQVPFESLQKAYNMAVYDSLLQNILKRMDRDTAEVVF